jgi:osmoprotectant transport system permease protein
VIRNRVLPVLFAAAAAAVAGSGFVAVAPNRLLSGRPVGLFAASDPALSVAIVALGVALLATALAPPRRALYRLAA